MSLSDAVTDLEMAAKRIDDALFTLVAVRAPQEHRDDVRQVLLETLDLTRRVRELTVG